MTKFADQLYEDLMREHGDALRSVSQPETETVPARLRRRATRPAWLTAGLVTGTGAVAGGFVLFGGATAPAYAVTQNPDGTVSVSVSQASAIDAANAKLTALGVRAVVVPVRAGCPSFDSVTMHNTQLSHGSGSAAVHSSVSVAVGGHNGQISSITINAKGVPADETIVLAFESTDGGVIGASGFVVGRPPACVSLPAPPIGGPGPGGGQTSGHQSGSSSAGSASAD